MTKLKIDLMHIKKITKLILVIMVYVTSLAAVAFLFLQFNDLKNKSTNLEQKVSDIQKSQDNFKENISDELFNEHLALLNKFKVENQLDSLSSQLEQLSTTQTGSLALNVKGIYDLYGDFQTKVSRNDAVKLDTAASKTAMAGWGDLILKKDFDNLKTQITKESSDLDTSYQKYVDSLPKVTAPASGNGYSYLTVTTEKGTKHGVYLIKVPLSQVKVKTYAAEKDDCSNNCPTKPLADYVKEANGFAGMNGSYNCPTDYPSCAGKTNSFDFSLYDSGDHKWLNKDALTWFKTGMFTFSGHGYDFYKKTSEYGGGSVEAGISNFPSLLKNGEVVVSDSDVTSYQKLKGLKGAIGVGGENLYLALISNASVTDAAYVMKALGVKHALNLDGGGSAAMYINGGYVVGPGRGLSTAIVLVK